MNNCVLCGVEVQGKSKLENTVVCDDCYKHLDCQCGLEKL